MSLLNAYGKISFIYFDDLKAACDFFAGVLELPLVCDQGWSKIYQICPGSFLGAVDRSRGACKATTRDGVLTSFVVLDFEEMVKRLEQAGIEFINPPHLSQALQIKSLMFVGPEGYKFEVEEFMNPADRAIFYPQENHED